MTKIWSHFQRQHTELKKYANQQIDSMKSEIVRLHEKISSYKAEMENVEQNRLQSLKDIDSSLSEGKGKNLIGFFIFFFLKEYFNPFKS